MINSNKLPEFYELAEQLRRLNGAGIAILGSGKARAHVRAESPAGKAVSRFRMMPPAAEQGRLAL